MLIPVVLASCGYVVFISTVAYIKWARHCRNLAKFSNLKSGGFYYFPFIGESEGDVYEKYSLTFDDCPGGCCVYWDGQLFETPDEFMEYLKR
jgi:hypothetical protein